MKRLTAFFLVMLALVQMLPGTGFAADNLLEVSSEQLEKPVYHAVSFMADGKNVATFFVAEGAVVSELPAAPEINGKTFIGWYDGDALFTSDTAIIADKTINAVYQSASDTSKSGNHKGDFNYKNTGAFGIVEIYGDCKKNQMPSVARDLSPLGGSAGDAWMVSNLKGNTTLTAEAVVTALPEDGVLSAYTIKNNKIGDPIKKDLSVGDTVAVELSKKGANGIVLVVENEEPAVEIEGALYANNDLYITGKIPGNGIIEVIPATVSIDGEELVAAYDINIYTNENQRKKGKTWQPAGKKVQVHWYNEAFVGELNVYHMNNDKAEYVTSVNAENGWVEFEAESFSIYAVTGTESAPRMFYTFYNGSTVITTEYITNIEEFYDPGVTPEYGQTFLGWAYDPAETNEGNMLTWEQLKADLETALAGNFSDGDEIKVYARFKEAYYLRYMVTDETGDVAVLKTQSVRVDAANKTVTVNCEYSEIGATFTGWINAVTGAVYQNQSTLTLDHHIDLYAKLSGRYWLVFNANTTGATFTGPQLIYDNLVTEKPDDPTKKGYIFVGWNSKPDGTGKWWYKADGSAANMFGGRISEDTILYAQWKGAPNSYTVLYWKQRATDDVELENAEKHYDLAGSETISMNVVTDGPVTLPAGYNTKGTTTNKNSEYYQSAYSWNDLAEGAKVAADGSTIVNVYYDLLAYHLEFQIYGYKYTPASGTSEPQYGFYNGSYVQIYYNSSNRTWYRTRTGRTNKYTYSNPYDGPRYMRSNSQSWHTIKDIYALYEHNISDQFPIVGNNGITYDQGERWDPQSNNQGWSEVMVLVETMPAEDVKFHLNTADRPLKTMNYYVEALPGAANTVNGPNKLYNDANQQISAPAGMKYVLYNSVSARYNGATIEDFLDLAGFEHLGTDTARNNNGFYIYDTSKDGTINFYYTRKVHTVTYYSNSEQVASDEVPYQANIKSYTDAQPAPVNGDDGFYFVGWYEDPACTVAVRSDLTMPDGDFPVYAKWDTYRVRVVFVPNCTDYWFANNQTLTFRVDYGESVSFGNVKPDVAKRPGYILTGWSLEPDFSGTPINTDLGYPILTSTPGVDMNYQSSVDWTNNTYGDNDGEHEDTRGILRFYARWQLNVDENAVYFLYEVEDGYCIFDAAGNNQTIIPVDATAHVMGTSLQIAEAPAGYASGVDFLDWMVLSKTGGATSVTHSAGNTIMLGEVDWEDYIDVIPVSDDAGNISYMKVVRLRARFTAEEDKATSIIFHGNGGSMSDGAETFTQVVPVNATIDLAVQSAAFFREHYTLIGWNTEEDGSGTTFATAQEIYANNEGLDEGESNHLYAIWQADIEITAIGPDEAVIFDGAWHSNTGEYTFVYTLGGEPITEAALAALGITITVSENGWPVATGMAKGEYIASDLTEEQLENLIGIDSTNYNEVYNIRRVYIPARLTIRDLLLTITKTVTGAFAEMNKPFTFTLSSVEGMTSGSFKVTITRAFEGTTTVASISVGGTFWMRHGDTVAIEGLPKGKNIIITEDNGAYDTTWTLGSCPDSPASGSSMTMILQDDDTLSVVNNLAPVAPTGYKTTIVPYALMLAAGLALLLLRGRRKSDADA